MINYSYCCFSRVKSSHPKNTKSKPCVCRLIYTHQRNETKLINLIRFARNRKKKETARERERKRERAKK